MELKLLKEDYSICQINKINQLNYLTDFYSITKTSDEISLVCKTSELPNNCTKIDNNWNVIKIEGILDFSLIGIISKISTLLANNIITIFVISTFNTDYFLVKNKDLLKTIEILKDNGYSFLNN